MKQKNNYQIMGFRRIIPMLFAGLLLSSTSDAQDKNLTLAMLAKQQGNLADAKKYIDEAAQHPETKNSAKMYNYRGQIYDMIWRNPADTTLYTPDAVYITAESFYKAVLLGRQEAKNAIVKEAREYLVPDVAAYLMGYIIDINIKQKDWTKALSGLDMMLDIYKTMDKRKQLLLEKGITDTMIYQYRIYVGYEAKKCDVVKQSFDSLMKLNYHSVDIYQTMEFCYTTEQQDTAKGLAVLDEAKKKFPNEKSLTDRELQLYMAMGREDLLLDKLNAAIAKTPADFPALFVRGNVYDKKILALEKKDDSFSDSVDVYKEKIRYAKTPAQKTALTTKQAGFIKMRDSLQAQLNKYIDLAESDYTNALKAASNDSGRADANFNLASLVIHRTRPILEKRNATQNEENVKKLDIMLNDKYREAIAYLSKFEKVYPDDSEALRLMKELYYKLSVNTKSPADQAKYEEYKKKYEALQNK